MNNEEAKESTPVQDTPSTGEVASFSEPETLEDALQMFNKHKQDAAQESVPVEEPVGKHAKPAGDGPAPEPVEPVGAPSAEDNPADAPQDTGGEGDSLSGGLSASDEGVDWTASEKQLAVDLQSEAKKIVLGEFKDKGKKIATIDMLTERTQDGDIVFHNPDTANGAGLFASRAEAQAWVNTWNSQLQNDFNRRVMEVYGGLMQSAGPQRQVMRFAKTYEAMSDTVKQIFDDLIEEYAVTDSNGDVVGFNVDLNAMAVKAQKMASKYTLAGATQSAPVEKKEVPAEEPAMDLKSGSSESGVKDPKTLEEAMMMLRDMKKEG